MIETQFDPNVWGPPLWDTLFTFCFHTGPGSLPDIRFIFNLLDSLLPCPHCRRSYALYRKKVNSISSIQEEEDDAAAKWLWTIHDLVNQKLGKICISFEALKRRHHVMQMLTSDMIILNLLCVIGINVKKETQRKFSDFARVLCRLMISMPAFFRLPNIMARIDYANGDVSVHMLHTANQLYAEYGLAQIDIQTLVARLKMAEAQDVE